MTILELLPQQIIVNICDKTSSVTRGWETGGGEGAKSEYIASSAEMR